MIVTTYDYGDFKTVIADNAVTPYVYYVTSPSGWRAWAIDGSFAATIFLAEEPETFGADFSATALNTDISLG